MDWARIQCERMGWIEPPKTLLDKVSRIFNNLGSEEAVEHIMSEYHRAFARRLHHKKAWQLNKGTSRMWASVNSGQGVELWKAGKLDVDHFNQNLRSKQFRK